MRFLAATACLAALAAPASARQAAASCPPAGWTTASLASLKDNKFAIADAAARQSLALALTTCLGDPNPVLRDSIAFEALTTWLRAEQLDRATAIALRAQLLPLLASQDPQGFRAPFAALIMAEVARTDRIKPWMTAEGRDALVQAAAAYLSGVQDYRAFNAQP